MKKLTLNGKNLTLNNELLDHTLEALSSTLRPVKKRSIARSFLKKFLGADTEHSLPEHVSASVEAPRATLSNNLSEVMVINVSNFEFDEEGITLLLEDVSSTICTKSSHDSHLRTIIRTHFPDNDGVPEDVLNLRCVEEIIDQDEEENEESTLRAKLEDMDAGEILDWLLDTVNLDEICDNVIPHVTMNMLTITSSCEDVKN